MRIGLAFPIGLLITSAAWAAAGDATPAAGSYRVEWREVGQGWVADASIEAVRQAVVATEVAGRILEVHAEAGQRIKAGQALMTIDAREAAAAVAAAEARVGETEAQYKRMNDLAARKFVSQAAADQAEAAYKTARAQLGQAGAGLSHARVASPMDGLVGQRLAEKGDLATPGKPLLTVFDPRSLRVTGSVPQSRLAGLKPPLKARIELPEQSRWLDPVRVEVLPTLDPVTRTATVRAYLADDSPGLQPGMAVRLHLLQSNAKRMVIPAAAILRRGEATLVYVLDEQGRASLRQVRVGDAGADGVEVLAGLGAGEQVSLDPLQTGLNARRKP